MLRYLGWNEAADYALKGVEGADRAKTVTRDLYLQMGSAPTRLSTTEFGDAIIQHMDD